MPPDVSLPEPTRTAEPLWLDPYPDVLIESELAGPPGPEARYETKEAISLAFVTALQLLPARQRAVLILRDVLGFRAAEVADMLDTSLDSVTSALKRARATLEHRPRTEAPPAPDSPAERELVGRLAAAFEANDVDGIVALLADDVRLTMPPLPLEFIGREEAKRFYAIVAARPGRRRLVPTRANGQPALAFYSRDPTGGVFRATSLMVITLEGRGVTALTRFDPSVISHFGLPRILPE
jgi:RNA polymerase sigma-70 factor (ECF subfamily)